MLTLGRRCGSFNFHIHYLLSCSMHGVSPHPPAVEHYELSTRDLNSDIFFDFSLTVKAAPHECVIRTGQP